jgi:hypothetical protein
MKLTWLISFWQVPLLHHVLFQLAKASTCPIWGFYPSIQSAVCRLGLLRQRGVGGTDPAQSVLKWTGQQTWHPLGGRGGRAAVTRPYVGEGFFSGGKGHQW